MSNSEQSSQYNAELLAFLTKACGPPATPPSDYLLRCLQIKAMW